MYSSSVYLRQRDLTECVIVEIESLHQGTLITPSVDEPAIDVMRITEANQIAQQRMHQGACAA